MYEVYRTTQTKNSYEGNDPEKKVRFEVVPKKQ